MRVNVARKFVYDYNRNLLVRDVEDDPSGLREIPAVGSLIIRHDATWKVIQVVAPVSADGTIPVVHVFLSRNAKGRPFFPK
ncbi:MAG: hypothetical protein WBD32_08695 [Acidobacteriaceae bacterium]